MRKRIFSHENTFFLSKKHRREVGFTRISEKLCEAAAKAAAEKAAANEKKAAAALLRGGADWAERLGQNPSKPAPNSREAGGAPKPPPMPVGCYDLAKEGHLSLFYRQLGLLLELEGWDGVYVFISFLSGRVG